MEAGGLRVVETGESQICTDARLFLHPIVSFSPDVNLLTVQCFLAKQDVQIQTQSARLTLPDVSGPTGKKKEQGPTKENVNYKV